MNNFFSCAGTNNIFAFSYSSNFFLVYFYLYVINYDKPVTTTVIFVDGALLNLVKNKQV